MAVANKKETKTKETTKSKVKTKKVKEETVEPIESEEKIEKVVRVKKSDREIRKELRKLGDEIEVYIINLSSGVVKFTSEKTGVVVFELAPNGDEVPITLNELAELRNGHKGFFEKHLIAVVDVDSEEYEIEDILNYLGVIDVYDSVENYDIDYIKYILTKMDNYDLEKLLAICDDSLAERIAERATRFARQGKLDSMKKQSLIAKRIGLEELIY